MDDEQPEDWPEHDGTAEVEEACVVVNGCEGHVVHTIPAWSRKLVEEILAVAEEVAYQRGYAKARKELT